MLDLIVLNTQVSPLRVHTIHLCRGRLISFLTNLALVSSSGSGIASRISRIENIESCLLKNQNIVASTPESGLGSLIKALQQWLEYIVERSR